MIRLNFIALHSRDMEAVVNFYNRLGLNFQIEQHGNGKPHYACQNMGVVFEIYPSRDGSVDHAMLGLSVPDIDEAVAKVGDEYLVRKEVTQTESIAILMDPDRRYVRLEERPKTSER